MLCGQKQHKILSLKIVGFVVALFVLFCLIKSKISSLAFLGIRKDLQTANKI